MAYTAAAVQIEPPLFTAVLNTLQPGQPIDQSTVAPGPVPPITAPTNDRGDLAIRGLFERGTTAIIDVRVTDLDCPSYRARAAASVLESQETAKKRKYQASCEARRCSFTPFVVSADGLLGKEAKALVTQLASILAAKQQRPYPPVKSRLLVRLAVALAKTTHLCLRASRRRPARHHPCLPPGPPRGPPEPDGDFQSRLF